MDPNNPGQNPGGPTPDPWAQPQPGQPQPGQPQPGQPQPEQPGYGAPQPPYGSQPPGYPPQQGWGTPPQGFDPSQQPYGQPPYGQPPYGQPVWGAPAPKKSVLPKVIGGVVLAVVAVIALLVVVGMLLPNHAGQVVFTSDAPTTEGAKTCKLGTQVSSIKLGDPVYVNIFFKDRLSNETVTMTILQDGKKLSSIDLPAEQSNGIDCVEDYSNWGALLQAPGTYEFKLTDSKGNVVSDGTLTVK
jgi:hypothetical protein